MPNQVTEREPPYYPIYGGYEGRAPFFFDPRAFPWVSTLEASWQIARDELDQFLRRGGALETNFDPYDFGVEGWKTINFYTYRRRYHASCAAFPRTLEVLESVPGLTSAFINLLEPHTEIPWHYGDSNAIARCHVGLQIPAPLPECGIQVGPERRGWQEGRGLVFCDAHRHSAWNHSDRPRLVLVVDVMRPEYSAERSRICGRVLAAIVLNTIRTRSPAFRRLRGAALRLLHHGLGRGIEAYTALDRRLHRA